MTASVENPFLGVKPESSIKLPQGGGFIEAAHRWSKPEIEALTFAWAADRPLLVRGEAGCGKSQLARAAAARCGGKLLTVVIHPRFEALELLYRFDSVRRLSDGMAQALKKEGCYLDKGKLWEAFNLIRAGEKTPVLLIDEIDKADADVPNALLEVLGNRSFHVPRSDEIIECKGRMPLMIITTNEERELPPAFVRRCAVLDLSPPEREAPFCGWLYERGRVHPNLEVDDGVRRAVAKQVWLDRESSKEFGPIRPGLAEYIDLLHALHALAKGMDSDRRAESQSEWAKLLRRYALQKNPGQQRESEESLAPQR